MSAAKKPKRNSRIAGIGVAAAACGVTRQHLQMVLTGGRESKPLLARYRAWKKQQRAAKNARLFPPAAAAEVAAAANHLATNTPKS